MQQADGFIVDPMIAPILRSGETGAIRKFLKDYAEYVTIWNERINEGVIPRRRAPKTMLRCADLDLRERIRKYDLNVEDGAELDEQAFRNYLLEKVAGARSEVRLDVILRGLRFDPYLKDPREKVGRVCVPTRRQKTRATWRRWGFRGEGHRKICCTRGRTEGTTRQSTV
jgi:hypothetical protein